MTTIGSSSAFAGWNKPSTFDRLGSHKAEQGFDLPSGFSALEVKPSMVTKTDQEGVGFQLRRVEIEATKGEVRYDGPADNDAQNLWGEIVADGKTIARIYKSGGVEWPTGMSLELDGNSSASDRAQQIVRQFGGTLALTDGPFSLYA